MLSLLILVVTEVNLLQGIIDRQGLDSLIPHIVTSIEVCANRTDFVKQNFFNNEK